MNSGEKLIAIENIICEFARNQFAANNISPMEAEIIMKAVHFEIQGVCLESFVMNRVQMVPPEGTEQQDLQKAKEEAHTGTVDDLKDAMKKTGFRPDRKEGATKG